MGNSSPKASRPISLPLRQSGLVPLNPPGYRSVVTEQYYKALTVTNDHPKNEQMPHNRFSISILQPGTLELSSD
ncbi:unnamed protein product [Linum trigynum]|uniref:Uncharacterized protein n=1 Tax=Linum trigynum TaxID=586398 RepID=A0AAV2CE68_9ROSI